MTAVGIADEVDDIADLEAGVCQQLLGLFDADGIEQVVIALLFYCIFRIRVRGSINFPTGNVVSSRLSILCKIC